MRPADDEYTRRPEQIELAKHQRGAELMTPIEYATLYLKFTA
ncbi:hypothetical protein ACXIZN_04630 [Amycolatopsis sp. TRM77291]